MNVRKLISLVIIVLLTAAIGYVGFFGTAWGIYEVKPFVEQVPKGLELAGGMSLLFELKEGAEGSASDMDTAAAILRKRLESTGYADASVVRAGENSVRADISISGTDQLGAAYISQYLSEPAKLVYKDSEGNVIFDNSGIARAFVQSGQQQTTANVSYVVGFKLTGEASKAFKDATSANIGKQFTVELNDKVIAQPIVSIAITNGTGYLDTGSFTAQSAGLLAYQLNSGALPVALVLTNAGELSATLGETAVDSVVMVLGIALAVVAVFFLARYRLSGLIADLSLLIYLLVFLMGLATIPGIRVNLPGVAAILVSFALAVNADALLLARLRDEILLGKTVRTAAKSGFAHAFIPIAHAHAVAVLLALVLLIAGNNAVAGFGGVLAVGAVFSFLHALATRGLFALLMGLPAGNKKLYVSRRAVAAKSAQ